MIGHPISVEQAIACNIATAAALALEPSANRNRLEAHVKDALRLAFDASALAFFEGDHALWVAKTAEMALELASCLDKDGDVAIHLLVTFLEHRVFTVVDVRFEQLCDRVAIDRRCHDPIRFG